MVNQAIRAISIPLADLIWFEKFEELKWTEKTSLSRLILEACKEYYLHHKEGNPGFKLDQFIEDPGMKAVPAFFRNRDDWQEYIEKLSEKDAEELLGQAQSINSMADKKVKYGSARAIVRG